MYNKSRIKRRIKTRHLSAAVTKISLLVDLAVTAFSLMFFYYIGLLFTIKEKMSVGNSRLCINDIGSHVSSEYEKIARIM